MSDSMNVTANWSYPTAVRFGPGRIAELADACAAAGITRPLLVTDSGLAKLAITKETLTLLNDESFVECAKALGEHLASCNAESDEERVRYAVQLCLAREPSEYELQRLLEVLTVEREAETETAPWTTLARVMLNLDEFITRE